MEKDNKDKEKEEDSTKLECSSTFLKIEEEEYWGMMLKYFQIKIETHKGLKCINKEKDKVEYEEEHKEEAQ